jgi:hypothetical protein
MDTIIVNSNLSQKLSITELQRKNKKSDSKDSVRHPRGCEAKFINHYPNSI